MRWFAVVALAIFSIVLVGCTGNPGLPSDPGQNVSDNVTSSAGNESNTSLSGSNDNDTSGERSAGQEDTVDRDDDSQDNSDDESSSSSNSSGDGLAGAGRGLGGGAGGSGSSDVSDDSGSISDASNSRVENDLVSSNNSDLSDVSNSTDGNQTGNQSVVSNTSDENTSEASPLSMDGLWSDPDTWPSGEVPSQGDVVNITSDMNVTLDVSPPDLEGIHVRGGNLTFARQDINVTTGFIRVVDHGEFRIGSEEDPYEHKATVTLTGSRGDRRLNMCGSKTICTIGGSLELHGAVDGPTSTQLAESVIPGDLKITLKEDVDWEAGDEIVLVSTSYEPDDVDKRTIASVDGDTVTLEEPVDEEHWGEIEQFGANGQYTVDERGEVLHLTRNIVIQGDKSSGDDNFGGHIMVHNEHHPEQHDRSFNGDSWPDIWEDYENNPELMPHVSGVELKRMGQEGVMARYPFHWHRYGNANGSYFEDSSIHNTYQRCVTLHGTQEARVENNVAFNATGHCYFLEGQFTEGEPVEGYEHGVQMIDNVGALVKPFSMESRRLIENDIAPSVFWTNGPPNSTFIGNTAAGAYGNGFWVDLANNGGHPPRLDEPLGRWRDNTAHSIHSNQRDDQTISMSQGRPFKTTGGASFFIEGGEGEFTNLTGYKSPIGFWNDDANELVVKNSEFGDTRNAGWFQDGGFRNSTVVAHTDNLGEPTSQEERDAGYALPEPANTRMGSAHSITGVVAFYQGARIANTAFIGFNSSDWVPHGVIGTMGRITTNPYVAAGTHLIDSNPYLPNLPKPGRELKIGSRVIPSIDGGLVGNYKDTFQLEEVNRSEYRELRWGSEHLTQWPDCTPIDYIGKREDHWFNQSVYSCENRSVSISFPPGNYTVNGKTFTDIGGKRDYLVSNETYKYQGTVPHDFEAGREGQIRIHRSWSDKYVVFKLPMKSEPSIKQSGQPPTGDLVEVNSTSEVQTGESIEDTRYYWDTAENDLWIRIVPNTRANDLDELPFKSRFGMPENSVRDNGVVIDP